MAPSGLLASIAAVLIGWAAALRSRDARNRIEKPGKGKSKRALESGKKTKRASIRVPRTLFAVHRMLENEALADGLRGWSVNVTLVGSGFDPDSYLSVKERAPNNASCESRPYDNSIAGATGEILRRRKHHEQHILFELGKESSSEWGKTYTLCLYPSARSKSEGTFVGDVDIPDGCRRSADGLCMKPHVQQQEQHLRAHARSKMSLSVHPMQHVHFDLVLQGDGFSKDTIVSVKPSEVGCRGSYKTESVTWKTGEDVFDDADPSSSPTFPTPLSRLPSLLANIFSSSTQSLRALTRTETARDVSQPQPPPSPPQPQPPSAEEASEVSPSPNSQRPTTDLLGTLGGLSFLQLGRSAVRGGERDMADAIELYPTQQGGGRPVRRNRRNAANREPSFDTMDINGTTVSVAPPFGEELVWHFSKDLPMQQKRSFDMCLYANAFDLDPKRVAVVQVIPQAFQDWLLVFLTFVVFPTTLVVGTSLYFCMCTSARPGRDCSCPYCCPASSKSRRDRSSKRHHGSHHSHHRDRHHSKRTSSNTGGSSMTGSSGFSSHHPSYTTYPFGYHQPVTNPLFNVNPHLNTYRNTSEPKYPLKTRLIKTIQNKQRCGSLLATSTLPNLPENAVRA
ncbi:unnamed protein product [Vitrella brassicaformis CCMP3155]|uniref:C2H2-type domain-containing protein n=1 Tax=Vitrella brassicaformis (strain CCMP3155) TaxID=1169540 RepID=A0A0G4FM34_VITBC|nr:unnamed protein product [Vitrella brassicaformis CCMP3155]|mmetsp:Transcript_4878/g.11323  ORF Transcript_4878/g.11323 Transcript_4878/m.11323 type:complete len:622 (-) Transcript_4878:695-2560(-)|eukprot:CEM14877.1 unnamed protein product [Vitrella brassicaformis CCMP3155]